MTGLFSISDQNKAGYTAGQLRMVGQGQNCKKRSQFKNVTDGLFDGLFDIQTDQWTNMASSRVAFLQLKIMFTSQKTALTWVKYSFQSKNLGLCSQNHLNFVKVYLEIKHFCSCKLVIVKP